MFTFLFKREHQNMASIKPTEPFPKGGNQLPKSSTKKDNTKFNKLIIRQNQTTKEKKDTLLAFMKLPEKNAILTSML
jgi:hypothetical protein